jgi:Protein of unknown function (DUF3106)
MSRLRQIFLGAAFLLAGFSVVAQISPPLPPAPANQAGLGNLVPPLPPALPSPVNFFRQLLQMSVAERANALTNRSPVARARILAKLQEYTALDPDERELRLRATELRWYLTPLLQTPPAGRDAALARVPEDLQPLVKSRLQQWDILPPPLQKEFLDNDRALHYFAGVDSTNRIIIDPRQATLAGQVDSFFELTKSEKEKALQTLSVPERAAMEKTLQAFDKLPPRQRMLCTRNYAKFAGMSAAERAEFLKNAEKWSQMSPKERQAWRDLVSHVPLWPPLPPSPVPPNLMPPMPGNLAPPRVATN